jgi:dephospho-CoA kinase
MQNKAAPPQRRGKNKLLIGITGGIGSGKTLASRYFENSGYKVIYADEAAKKLYRSNKALKQKLVKEFGKGILDDKGNISGLAARRIILSGKKNIKRVNRIVHPFVVKEINRIIKSIKDRIVFVEAAIMFDSFGLL